MTTDRSWNPNPRCCSTDNPSHLCANCRAMVRNQLELAMNTSFVINSNGPATVPDVLPEQSIPWQAVSNANRGVEDDDDEDYDDDELTEVERENRRRMRMAMNSTDVLADVGGFASVAAERKAAAARTQPQEDVRVPASAERRRVKGRRMPDTSIDWAAMYAERHQK